MSSAKKDDLGQRAPASAEPETDSIDSSWDEADDGDGDGPEISVEIEIHDGSPADEEESIHERVTAVPKYHPDDVLESGFHEVEPPTTPLEIPKAPVPSFDGELDLPPGPRRPPSVELDDPLSHFQPDLDTESPSEHPVPIEDRVTPVHEPPASLLELALDAEQGGVDPDIGELKERYAVGDFSGALEIAEKILVTAPDHAEARRYAMSCREVLLQMYTARLGSLAQAVSLVLPSDQIRWLSLDHRAGFLLSLVDGSSSVEEILDICGMPRLDAIRILYTLFEQRVISLSPRE